MSVAQPQSLRAPRQRPARDGHLDYRPPRRRPVARVARKARSILFWVHLMVGVVTGVVVLAMSLTGTLLAFQRQLLDWSASRHVVAAEGATRLPLDSVVAIGRGSVPADVPISTVTIRRDADAPVTFGLSARRYAYVDPYTGAVLPPNPTLQGFFFETERWHRAMSLGEGLRGKPGVTITGAANLGFLFLIISGALLWIPRQASWRAVRAVLLFERGVRGRRRDWNWHHVLGVWFAPVLFFLVLSGVFISYRWPTDLLGRAFGEAPAAEARSGSGAGPAALRGERSEAPSASVATPHFGDIAARAAAEVPGWHSIQLRMPREGTRNVTANVSTTPWVRPDTRTALSFDAASGTMKVEPGYESLSPARKLRSWVRGVHTGEALGPVGQAVAALACLAGVVLVWTGIALAWRRMLRTFAGA